jgi:hypothetical protein
MVILSFCLFVIAAILILPQVDLLDAAGTEVTAVANVKCHFGAPTSVRPDRLPVATRHENLSPVDLQEPHPCQVVVELHASQDLLCCLRC